MGQYMSHRASSDFAPRALNAMDAALPAILSFTMHHHLLAAPISSDIKQTIQEGPAFLRTQNILFNASRFLAKSRYHQSTPSKHDEEALSLLRNVFGAYLHWTNIYESGGERFSASYSDSAAMLDVLIRPLLTMMAKLTRESACGLATVELIKSWNEDLNRKIGKRLVSNVLAVERSDWKEHDGSVSVRGAYQVLVHLLWYWTQEGRIVHVTDELSTALVEHASRLLQNLKSKLSLMISPEVETEHALTQDDTFDSLWNARVLPSLMLWPAESDRGFSPWLHTMLQQQYGVEAKTPSLEHVLTITYDSVDELIMWLTELHGLHVTSLVIEDRVVDVGTRLGNYWRDPAGLQLLQSAAAAFSDTFNNAKSALRSLYMRRCGWLLWMGKPRVRWTHLEVADVPEWEDVVEGDNDDDVALMVNLVRVVSSCGNVTFDRVPERLVEWLPDDMTAKNIEFVDEIAAVEGAVQEVEGAVQEVEEASIVSDDASADQPIARDEDDGPPSPVYSPEEARDAEIERIYREQTGRTGRLFIRPNAAQLDATYRPRALHHVNLLNCKYITERFLASHYIAVDTVYLTTDHAPQIQELLTQGARFQRIHILAGHRPMQSVDLLRALDTTKWQLSDVKDLVIGHASVDPHLEDRVRARLCEVLTGVKRSPQK